MKFNKHLEDITTYEPLFSDTAKKITDCIKSKHLTNNGKNVIELQKNIK